MPPTPLGIDGASPPFDRFKTIHWLTPARRGRDSPGRGRHQLYVAREKRNPVNVLIKVMAKAGLVYEQDIANEIATLSTINRELPDSRYFPELHDHGRLGDGRLYVITSLFDEFPLANAIGEEPAPEQLVLHLRIAIEIARALVELHALGIFHVDLNPMNVLYRPSHDRPVIRIIDFESSFERARHAAGCFYSPPTTPGYSAPEVRGQAPDARADVFSLGALLYSLVAGDQGWDGRPPSARAEADVSLDAELKQTLLKALAITPRDRYPSAQDFLTGLGAYLERIWPGRRW